MKEPIPTAATTSRGRKAMRGVLYLTIAYLTRLTPFAWVEFTTGDRPLDHTRIFRMLG